MKRSRITGVATTMESDDDQGESGHAGRVYGSLRQWILLGGVAVGSVVAVSAVVRNFGARRADARRALQQLESDGLVAMTDDDRGVVTEANASPAKDYAVLADEWERQRKDPGATPGSDYP
jgi:DNA-binding GntR family transcriptional regulator